MFVTYIYHRGEGVYDVLLAQGCDGLGVVASDLVGDVGEKLGEVGHFENFVEGEELQRGDSCAFQDGRERTVREWASSFLLDLGELGWVRIGETVRQWEFEWSGGDTGGCDGDG